MQRLIWIAISFKLIFLCSFSGASSYRFSEPGRNSDRCHRQLVTEASSNLDKLSAHLQVRPEAMQSLLNSIENTSIWEEMSGFEIHGSRTHKYWGAIYDLDIGLLPIDKSTNENIFGVWNASESGKQFARQFLDAFGIRLDFSFSHRKSLSQLILDGDIPSAARISLHLRPLEQQLDSFVKWKDEPNLSSLSLLSIIDGAFNSKKFEGKLRKVLREKEDHLRGNHFFEMAESIGDNSLENIVPMTYMGAARGAGFSPQFLSVGTVFILKRTSQNSELATQLAGLGYPYVYFFCEQHRICKLQQAIHLNSP